MWINGKFVVAQSPDDTGTAGGTGTEGAAGGAAAGAKPDFAGLAAQILNGKPAVGGTETTEGTGTTGTGTTGEADEMEVDLDGGVKIKLPKEQAKKIIAKRNERNARLKELEGKALLETKKALEAEVKKAVTQEEMIRVIETNNALVAAEKAKVNALAKSFVRSSLVNKVATSANLDLSNPVHQVLAEKAVADVANQVSYSFDEQTFEVITADGSPALDTATGRALTVDQVIATHLTANPWLVQKKTTPSTRTQGTKVGDVPAKKTFEDMATDILSGKR